MKRILPKTTDRLITLFADSFCFCTNLFSNVSSFDNIFQLKERPMIRNNLLRIDNIGIVVEDLKAAIAFFLELGLELEGEMTVEGQWVDRVVGLDGVPNDIANGCARACRHPWCETNRRSGAVRGHVSAMLHPRAGRHYDCAGAAARKIDRQRML